MGEFITVLDDAILDVLTGNTERDWFFADSDGQDGDDDDLTDRTEPPSEFIDEL